MRSPATFKELYNLRHAKMRNVIERIFGVIKKKFKLFTRSDQFSPGVQARILVGLAVLYNIIKEIDHSDPEWVMAPEVEEDVQDLEEMEEWGTHDPSRPVDDGDIARVEDSTRALHNPSGKPERPIAEGWSWPSACGMMQ